MANNNEEQNYNDMPPLIDINQIYNVRNIIRQAIENSTNNLLSIPHLTTNNLPPLIDNPIIQNISPLPGDYEINFDVLYTEHIGLEIKPYLINIHHTHQLVRFTEELWNLFEMVAKIREKVVFITIYATNENSEYKTIICPESLINNYDLYGDQYIIVNDRTIYCAPDSDLYRGCQWTLEHTQPFHYNE